MSIWNVTGTNQQRQLVAEAIAVCDFPFDALASSLAKEGKTSIQVGWEDLSRYAADDTAGVHTVERVVDGRRAVLGLFYLPPYTRVVLDASLVQRPPLAREVFLAEAAHAVDYHFATAEHRRTVVNAVHRQQLPPDADVSDGVAFRLDGHTCSWFDVGPYSMWVGETFMEAFIESFAPSVAVTIELGHPVTPAAAASIRAALLAGTTPDPEPVPPTPAPAPDASVYQGGPRSPVFHDAHKGIAVQRRFATSADALDAGLRPCGVCRPATP